jgi:hypothetical protein
MNRMAAACAFFSLVLLAACGDDGESTDPVDPVGPVASEDTPTPAVTAEGEPNAPAVTQVVDANGGIITAAGIAVRVPSASASGASITVQPITNVFVGVAVPGQAVAAGAPGAFPGIGHAVAISSTVPWSRHLKVTFPLSDEEIASGSIPGLAVQQSNGSWRFLAPVKIDPVARTLSAGLPYDTEASQARPAGASRTAVPAAGAPATRRVAKSWVFRIEGGGPARLPTLTRTTLMVPYAYEQQNTDPACQLPPPDPSPEPPLPGEEDDLGVLTPNCWKAVLVPQALRNRKEGYLRQWTVDTLAPGDFKNGRIDDSPEFGAYFTTPDHLTNSLHTIRFTSERIGVTPKQRAVATAFVQVFKKAPPLSYKGPVRSDLWPIGEAGGLLWSAEGDLVLDILPSELDPLHPGEITRPNVSYRVREGVELPGRVTEPGCTTLTDTLAAKGRLTVNVDTGQYSFEFTENEARAQVKTCGLGQSLDTVRFAFNTLCHPVPQQRTSEDAFEGTLPRTNCQSLIDYPAGTMQGQWSLKATAP